VGRWPFKVVAARDYPRPMFGPGHASRNLDDERNLGPGPKPTAAQGYVRAFP